MTKEITLDLNTAEYFHCRVCRRYHTTATGKLPNPDPKSGCHLCGKVESTMIGPVTEVGCVWLCNECALPILENRRYKLHLRKSKLEPVAIGNLRGQEPPVPQEQSKPSKKDIPAPLVVARSIANEAMPSSALEGAEYEQVAEQDVIGSPTVTLSDFLCPQAVEQQELPEATFCHEDVPVHQDLEREEEPHKNSVTLSRTRRRLLPLSRDERQEAIELGILSSPAKEQKCESGSSVLDDYEPMQKVKPTRSTQIPKTVLAKKAVQQNGRCKYCDRPFGTPVVINGKIELLRAEADHFRPVADRRNDNPSNIHAACHVCNRLKSSRVFSNVNEAQQVLKATWQEKGYVTAPPLVPFNRSAFVACWN